MLIRKSAIRSQSAIRSPIFLLLVPSSAFVRNTFQNKDLSNVRPIAHGLEKEIKYKNKFL